MDARLEVVPAGWYRGIKDASTADGPGEWYVDYSHGDDRPEGEGWLPLYGAARNWQPIETAPTDGSLFVAWGVTIMDEYDEDDRLVAKGKRHEAPVIAYWFSITGLPGGEFVESPYTRKVMNRRLTHWLPLPVAPAPAKAWEGVVG